RRAGARRPDRERSRRPEGPGGFHHRSSSAHRGWHPRGWRLVVRRRGWPSASAQPGNDACRDRRVDEVTRLPKRAEPRRRRLFDALVSGEGAQFALGWTRTPRVGRDPDFSALIGESRLGRYQLDPGKVRAVAPRISREETEASDRCVRAYIEVGKRAFSRP